VRIHAALCRICGEGIKKAGEQVCPAVRPFYLPGYSIVDVAHRKCANRAYAQANTRGTATSAPGAFEGGSE
jgi:hypothetical protein